MSQPAFVSVDETYEVATLQGEPLDGQQLSALYAVLSYISHNQHAKEEKAQVMLEKKYGVDSVAKIARRNYQQAIKFLIDLRMDDVRSRK